MAVPVRTTLVYVVDDDTSVRTSLERLMRAEGFPVRAYARPERFLEEVDPSARACVILDIAMPGMSGLEVQRRLLERGLRLPIIALSSHDDDATRLDARRLGARFFFRKPVDGKSLVDAIEWVVSGEG